MKPLLHRARRWRRLAEAGLAAGGLDRALFGRAIVHPGHFAHAGAPADGLNINGPSLVRVPDWVPRRAHPEARYYLYFAHHIGRYLRMAWAPALEGPWTLFGVGGGGPRGVFDIDALGPAERIVQEGLRIGSETDWALHVASPDVHLDPARRRFVCYAHLPLIGHPTERQLSFGLESEDGLRFSWSEGGPVPLGASYFRVFTLRGARYAVSPGGWLWQAPEPGWALAVPWRRGPRLLEVPAHAPRLEDGRVRDGAVARHLAVEVREGALTVYFSRVADAPERILAADVDLQGDWQSWRAGEVREVHRARAPWEGARVAPRPSSGGVAAGGVNEVRDPYLFTDEDGRRVLLYSVQGERAIGLRTLG